MQIGIDASPANREQRTGTEWYTYHVIDELKRIAVKEDVRVVLYSQNPLRSDMLPLPDSWRSRVLSWPLPGWITLRLSLEQFLRKSDALFVPANRLPKILSKNTVTTVHDIGPDRVPEVYDPEVLDNVQGANEDAVKRASKIITISEFTKKELMDEYGLSDEQIIVAPLAADIQKYKPLDTQVVQSVLAHHEILTPYFFHVGRVEKKKNILNLVKAFEKYKQRTGNDTLLVLAGHLGYGGDEVADYVSESRYANDIRGIGYVEENDLVALMNGALAYVFPSFYEGFGIPALEAMACNTPLIASDIGALREVAGDAAIFADPNSIDEWAGAMEKIEADKHLRSSLVHKGAERVKQFSWQKTAQKIWSVIISLV